MTKDAASYIQEDVTALLQEPGSDADLIKAHVRSQRLVQESFKRLFNKGCVHSYTYRSYRQRYESIFVCMSFLPKLYAIDIISRAGICFSRYPSMLPKDTSYYLCKPVLLSHVENQIEQAIPNNRAYYKTLVPADSSLYSLDEFCEQPIDLRSAILDELRYCLSRSTHADQAIQKKTCALFDKYFEMSRSAEIFSVAIAEMNSEFGHLYEFLKNKRFPIPNFRSQTFRLNFKSVPICELYSFELQFEKMRQESGKKRERRMLRIAFCTFLYFMYIHDFPSSIGNIEEAYSKLRSFLCSVIEDGSCEVYPCEIFFGRIPPRVILNSIVKYKEEVIVGYLSYLSV